MAIDTFLHPFQEMPPILIVTKDGAPLVAPRRQMIPRPRMLDAQRSCSVLPSLNRQGHVLAQQAKVFVQ